MRVLLLGATGTIGQATATALVAAGHSVVCFLRGHRKRPDSPGTELRFGDVTDPDSIRRDGFQEEQFDVVVSCLASRTGVEGDAWAIDYQAHFEILNVAKVLKVPRFILLSAICVQKPLLPFQKAKLAFETELHASGLT